MGLASASEELVNFVARQLGSHAAAVETLEKGGPAAEALTAKFEASKPPLTGEAVPPRPEGTYPPEPVMSGEVVKGGALPAVGESEGGKIELGVGDERGVPYSGGSGSEPTVQQRAEAAFNPEAEQYQSKRDNRQAAGEHADTDAAATDAAITEENWRPPLKEGNYPSGGDAGKLGVGVGALGVGAAGALAAGGDSRNDGASNPGDVTLPAAVKSRLDSTAASGLGARFPVTGEQSKPSDATLFGGKPGPGANVAGDLDTIGKQGGGPAPTAQEAAKAGGVPSIPSQPTGNVKADKSLMDRAQQALSDLQMAHEDPASRVAIDKVNEMVEQVKQDYAADKGDLAFGQAWETVANALGKLGAGLYGMQHNVDMSGTKFDKQDWLGEMKNLREEFATRLADVEGERKAVESKREHDLRFGEAKARVGEAYDQMAVNQQTAREHNASAERIASAHVAATREGIAASAKQHQDMVDVHVADLNNKGEHDAAVQLRELGKTEQAEFGKLQGDLAAAVQAKDKGKFAAAAVTFNNMLTTRGVPPKERDAAVKEVFGTSARDLFDSSRISTQFFDDSIKSAADKVNTKYNEVSAKFPLSNQIVHRAPLNLPYGLNVGGQPRPSEPAATPRASANQTAYTDIKAPPGPPSDWAWSAGQGRWIPKGANTAGR